MAMRANELRKGHVIQDGGQLWQIVEMEHVKPGKGPAYLQIKRKSLSSGKVIETRYNSSASVEFAYLETRELKFGWPEGETFVFMDSETYEQFHLSEEIVGSLMPYIKADETITVKFHDETPVTLDLPQTVELQVVDTEPAVKGDTVTNCFKPAKLETGLEIKVPMFIAEGEVVKVTTATGEFGGRANK